MELLIILVLVVVLVIGYIYFYDGTEPFKSTVNNKYYRVRGNNEMKQVKCNLLAVLHDKLVILVESLRNDSKVNKNQNVIRLLNNWDSGITIKETGNMESDAAYVINKKYMSICLKNFCETSQCSNVNSLENINLLTYVGIHELSHIMSEGIGHDDEFKDNFKFLLDYSQLLKYLGNKLYINLSELNTPSNYCGVSIINSIS